MARGDWSEYVEQTIESLRSRAAPLRDDAWEQGSENCRKGELWRLMGFLHFIVSDWLTIAPSHVPFVGGSAAGTWAQVEQVKILASQGFLLSDALKCFEAQYSFSLFSMIVDGVTSPLQADSFISPMLEGESDNMQKWHLSWRQVATSEWPILGLIAQKLRLEAQLFPEGQALLLDNDACGRFLELVPNPPFTADILLSAAIRFFDKSVDVTPTCNLASSLALAIMIQDLPKQKALSAVGVIASLLESSSYAAAARSKVFYLLDQVMACHGKHVVKSSGKRQFTMHIQAAREHVADRIRFFDDNHCGIEEYFGISLEDEVVRLLQHERNELLVVEVGSALGQCLLPLLLIRPGSVRAVSVEPVRHLRHLFSQSLDDNNVSQMVEFMSNLVVPEADSTGSFTMHYDVGHQTIDGAGESGLRPFSLKQETTSITLSKVIGSKHVDLLIIYPPLVCISLARGLEDVKCERWLGNRFPYCIFLDCRIQNRSTSL